MNEGILSESTKKNSMLYLKSEVFYVFIFFHFLLDIISRSRYHIISTHIKWNFFHLFGKLKDNKTDVDLK